MCYIFVEFYAEADNVTFLAKLTDRIIPDNSDYTLRVLPRGLVSTRLKILPQATATITIPLIT